MEKFPQVQLVELEEEELQELMDTVLEEDQQLSQLALSTTISDLQPLLQQPELLLLVDLDLELLEETETSEVLVLLDLEKETVATLDVIDLFRNKYYLIILVLSMILEIGKFIKICWYLR